MMDHMEQHITEQAMREDAGNVVASHAPPLLIVSIMCEEGKHRSVGFAEELPRHVKRKGWEVTVQHRDLPSSVSVGSEHDDNGNVGKQDISRRLKMHRDQERRKGRSAGGGFLQDDDL